MNKTTAHGNDSTAQEPTGVLFLAGELEKQRRLVRNQRDVIWNVLGRKFVLDISELNFVYEPAGYSGWRPLNALRTAQDWAVFLDQAGHVELDWAIERLRPKCEQIISLLESRQTGTRAVLSSEPASTAEDARPGVGDAQKQTGRRDGSTVKLVGKELEAERAQVKSAIARLASEGIDPPKVSELAKVLVDLAGTGSVEAKRRWLDDHPEVLEGVRIRRNRQRRRPQLSAAAESPNLVSESPKIAPEPIPDLR